jgi:hypothetical protein
LIITYECLYSVVWHIHHNNLIFCVLHHNNLIFCVLHHNNLIYETFSIYLLVWSEIYTIISVSGFVFKANKLTKSCLHYTKVTHSRKGLFCFLICHALKWNESSFIDQIKLKVFSQRHSFVKYHTLCFVKNTLNHLLHNRGDMKWKFYW